MIRKVVLTVCFISVLLVKAQSDNSYTIPKESDIRALLEQNKVPGVAIGLINNGAIKNFVTIGKSHINDAITKKTIFDVASLTKTVTTELVLQLTTKGKWDLDEPLYKYWVDPDIKNDPHHKLLTTRHVLRHSTGFKNWRWMNEDNKLQFDFEPGTKFQYSGEGFEYLRKALENKFETTFQKLVDENVFAPNNMNNSSLVWDANIANLNFAGTHDKEGEPYTYEKSISSNAADNLLTSVEEFSQLGVHTLKEINKGNSIYQEMITKHSEVRPGIDFGLGWIIFKDLPNDEYALFNAGSDKGVNALIVLLPKSKNGLVILTNGDGGRALAMNLVSIILGDLGSAMLSRF